jgi:hypothetical protein
MQGFLLMKLKIERRTDSINNTSGWESKNRFSVLFFTGTLKIVPFRN